MRQAEVDAIVERGKTVRARAEERVGLWAGLVVCPGEKPYVTITLARTGYVHNTAEEAKQAARELIERAQATVVPVVEEVSEEPGEADAEVVEPVATARCTSCADVELPMDMMTETDNGPICPKCAADAGLDDEPDEADGSADPEMEVTPDPEDNDAESEREPEAEGD